MEKSTTTLGDGGVTLNPHGLLSPPPTVVDSMDISEQGGSSWHDYGYGSHESPCLVMKDAADFEDTAGISPVDFISPETRNRYIATLSRRLTEDTGPLPGFPTISKGSRDLLEEWLETFSVKLQGESSTRNGQEASIFIQKYRKDIIHELGVLALDKTASGGQEEESMELCTPAARSDNYILKWAENIGAPEEMDMSGIACAYGDDLDFPNLGEYERVIPKSEAYKWLLSRIDSHAQLEAQGENCLIDIGDEIRAQVMLQKAFLDAGRRSGPPIVQIIFHLDWDIERFETSQEFSLPLSKILDHVICLTGTCKQAQAMTVAEYMNQTWPLTNESFRALVKKRLNSPDVRIVHCELPHGYYPRLHQVAC